MGDIDEVAFWNSSLTAAQVLSVYNAGLPTVGITVLQQPADVLAHPGDTATFTVAASAVGTSSPLQYQWQRNGVNLAGATNTSYTTPALTTADNGTSYHCLVNAGGIAATSQDAFLTVIDVSSAYATAVLADHPLVYYRFEELGGGTAYDSATNGINGTYANVGHVPSISTVLGHAAAFTSSSIAVPALVDPNLGMTFSQMSIEVWVNVSTFDDPGGFECLYNHDGWSSGWLHMHVNPGNRWEFSVNGNSPTDSYLGDPTQPGLLLTNSWYHLVATYDADTSTLLRYVNGQLVTNLTYTSTVPLDLGAAHIGAWSGSSRYYIGLMDEFAIYDTILTPERIAEHYRVAGVPQNQAKILSFGLPGFPSSITGNNIAWTVPNGTDVTALAPTYTVSYGATGNPASGSTRNFTSPQTYTITSGDSTATNVYTVTVIQSPTILFVNMVAVSASSSGATDAADMCMNSRYPPTVAIETPANAITPEANL